MGWSLVLVILIVEGFILWWLTTFSKFRLFVWLICCALYWPPLLSGAHRDSSFPYLVGVGLVWTFVPPLAWIIRRNSAAE